MAEAMQYRAQFESEPGVFKDVFDGRRYQQLRETNVSLGQQ